MKMPGFTAESTLYKVSEPFKFNLAWVGGVAGQEVIPQALAPPVWCTYGCIPYIHIDELGRRHVICGRRWRCCYNYYGTPLGCNWV